MIRFLTSKFPAWAQPDHPILQYELAHLKQSQPRWILFLKVLGIALLLSLIGYLYASYVYVSPTKGNFSDLAWRTVYFPTLLVQVLTSIAALSYGIGAVGQERSKRTWDNLRATEVGAEMTLRARWIAILYRLRMPIVALLLIRVILLLSVLYDITAFAGHYTDMLMQGITPTISHPIVGLLIIALIMTANILLPLTMIASSAAIGILISVVIKNRAYAVTMQVILVFFQLMVIIGLLIAISRILQGQLELGGEALFAVFMGYSSFGDWGLLLAQLGSAGEIWATVPYGIFIGAALIGVMLIQSAISDGMIWLAVKLSESGE